MFVENIAAGLLRRYWREMNKRSLRVFIYKIKLPTKTKKRVANILFGVVTNLRLIDWIINRAYLNAVEEKDLLRILIFRLAIENNKEVMQRIRKVDNIPIEDLANKVEAALRELNNIPAPQKIAITLSYPDFLVRRLSKYLDLVELEKLLKVMNYRLPYTWACVNTCKYTREWIIERLHDDGFRVYPDSDFYDLIRFEELPRRIEKSQVFKLGAFILMEKASLAATHALEPKAGDVILDMAAAPGIKLIATGFKMGEGKIYAVDISKERVERLRYMVRRYLSGTDVEVKIIIEDARKLKPEDFSDVNKIILDAECSSTGMIPKSPDIKLRIDPNRIKQLSKLQTELLAKAIEIARYTNAEFIVYSTCSILPEEGEYIIRYFVNKEDISILPMNFGRQAYIPDLGVRFFPHTEKTIGFFISKFCVK
ncbi:MAG: RsmB/NOP family class I SAM-dependent RNA methyltransferase [Candidatus Korarchaeota archaeon]|nr:RsmB/NOP family class I SAM-dependent RNA methyltransferase [Thermoproteota archaeon]MCR8463279.1 RsmB/NOP family class I SAM-dependent RNA methyltransferase [Thermoproteota archaeon]MCR8471238.1 RsmB/NOP family class I SAM-dependent RNA methyltransferase [Thermoproteota archaeon]MCR8472362.1 RsmB/NOP family class I SAM-dependent RNA methyltransferase [Thermoproteota archaeon]MCR8473521.1 RsmB/NOP family class I SAM-dependent RNA methyltransferase [Thermoproteota archaeon]